MITLPSSESSETNSARERELQVVCLGSQSLLGLLVVLTVCSVLDVAYKMYLLIRRATRRRRKVIKYSVPHTSCNSLVSEADESQNESKKNAIKTSAIQAIEAVKPAAELALAKGIYFNLEFWR